MPALLCSKEVKEQIAERLEEAQALSTLAEKEERDLTAEEKARVDTIFGEIGDDADDKAGTKPTGLRADLARALRFEAETTRLREQRLNIVRNGIPSDGPRRGAVDVDDSADDDSRPRAERITIPARARRTGILKSYSGPNAEKEAFIAGQFLLATVINHDPSKEWCRNNGVDIKFRGAMTGADNTLGGFLVPEEMERSIINLRERYGVFRREARIVPMGSDTKYQPRRTAGLTGYWTSDNDTITSSDLTLDNVQLVAKKLAALCLYSSEINEDEAVGLGDLLTSEIAQTFAYNEDLAGFIGDGTSTYGGISGLISAVQAGSTVTATTGNTAFSTLDLVDFENMIGKLPQYADIGNAKWYISRAGWAASMMRLADAAGGTTAGEIEGKREMMFLGYPVVFSQVMNSTLTAQTSTDGLCYFGDLRQTAMLGDRRGMSIAVSTDRYFELDQLAIKGTERLDINVHEVGDATNAGSIIMLSTPSS